ncbi:ATP synthase F0 subunit B (plasmid) [Streptomyces erythrochromogenes]|uniref:ATP synthase F0 subunit B n=1 Tax=Streptomyces erythrochromogenes TaxID=285574 RepID=A0ABZ1QPG9_9ACTN|nr:ATP synthase F0 subunit B [Streptomyces erythrochromogenes]
MATEAPGAEPQDREAIDAYEAALHAFAEKLNLVHISGGTPSYATVAAASVRPRLTTTGLNEMLTGKRLPTLEALLEYLRVVTTPSGLDKPAAAKFRADAALIQEWRGHWQDAKLLQRRAQAATRKVRAAARQAHDDVVRDAEALRTEAHTEAERIRTSAHADAEDIRAQARRDADELLDQARETKGATTLDTSEPRLTGSRVVRVGLPPGLGRVPGLRPAGVVLAVAVVAVATILVGDSFTGTPGDCREGRTQAAELNADAVASNDHGNVRPVAFAAEPAAFITLPAGHPLLRGFPTPSTSSTTEGSPTSDTSPTPQASPTPSPSTTPTPAPSQSARCKNSSG